MKRTRESLTMLNLPLHILMEIISRLPIKTVMAIRCVCKSLLSLVSDSHFQMLHSTRAPTELFYIGWTKSSTTLCIAEYVFQDDSLTGVYTKKNSFVFELPNFSVQCNNKCNFGATKTTVRFVNSCYGLLCFSGEFSYNIFAVICNPFTGEYITFPCPARTEKPVKRKCICYGLGFSPKDNCFKLLRLVCPKNVDPGSDDVDLESRIVVDIYTFGERGSWKTVASRPHVCMTEQTVVIFHEGALHWYCTSSDVIVTFDFDTELFGKLVTPPHMCDMSSSEVRLSLAMGVFENCLFTTGCVGDFVDIWALKEYDQGSWVKMFSIRKDVNRFSERYEPFKYLQNGEVLMFKSQRGIVCFNPDKRSIKNVSAICCRYGAVFIRPSLVSLKVLLGDSVKVRSVKLKPWDRKKASTIPRVWTSSVAVKADKDSRGCVSGSSAPKSSSEASASTFHPTKEKVNDDVCPAILASQRIRGCGSDYEAPVRQRRRSTSSGETERISELETRISQQDEVITELRTEAAQNAMMFRHFQEQLRILNPDAPPLPFDPTRPGPSS